ncbi:hypothetical protein BGZ51_005888 [Haplosporangium sp. Z 767]|nr:hypothetical protein BGZ51_005888 [Haplosporangium sp. Z 767]
MDSLISKVSGPILTGPRLARRMASIRNGYLPESVVTKDKAIEKYHAHYNAPEGRPDSSLVTKLQLEILCHIRVSG